MSIFGFTKESRDRRQRDANSTTMMLIVVIAVFLAVEIPLSVISALHTISSRLFDGDGDDGEDDDVYDDEDDDDGDDGDVGKKSSDDGDDGDVDKRDGDDGDDDCNGSAGNHRHRDIFLSHISLL